MVTPDEIADPYNLHMSCTVHRGANIIFSGETTTASLCRKFETLIEFLLRGRKVRGGGFEHLAIRIQLFFQRGQPHARLAQFGLGRRCPNG